MQQEEINPEMDIIHDLDLGEDEQMQSQSSGDTEILIEQLHIVDDMEVTQEQPQHHEEIEGQGSDTQEPVALHLLIKATADNQADGEIKIQEEVATQIGADEPETENIPDFNEEIYDVTLELSWGT